MTRTREPGWPVRIGFLVLPLAAFLLLGGVRHPPPPPRHVLGTFGARGYDLTVAETQAQQSRGLQGLPEPPVGGGMLFPFDPPQEVTMVIKTLPYPVDVVFVGEQGQVWRTVSIQPTPLGIQIAPSGGRVRYAVELRRGALASGDVRVGSSFRVLGDLR